MAVGGEVVSVSAEAGDRNSPSPAGLPPKVCTAAVVRFSPVCDDVIEKLDLPSFGEADADLDRQAKKLL